MLLISLYDKYKFEYFDPKIRKLSIWKKISKTMRENGFDYSSACCDSKWRNLKKSYRTSLQNDGSKPVRWKYFEPIQEILSKPPHTYIMSEDGKPIDITPMKRPKLAEESGDEIGETVEMADLSQFLVFEAHDQNETAESEVEHKYKRKKKVVFEDQNETAESDVEHEYGRGKKVLLGPPKVRKRIPRQVKPRQRKSLSVENGKLVFNILEMNKNDSSSEEEENDESAPVWFKKFVKRHRKDEKRKMEVLQAMHNDLLVMEREKLMVLKSLIERLPTS